MRLRLALAVVMAVPSVAFAQEATRNEPPLAPDPGPRTAPVMNGHTFLPSLLVDTPFRETTAKLGLLYGIGKATGNQYNINGDVVGTADYTFAALGQIFR